VIALGALTPPPDLAQRVEETEYARLLGYPDGRIPASRVAELAAASRAWYGAHGRPWVRARAHRIARIAGERIELGGGETLTSGRLAERLAGGGATGVVAAAVSAGDEVDDRSAGLWRDERPDEAYFLDRLGAAAAEHLAAWIGARLREAAAGVALAALPAYSPGYPGWALEEQRTLARCLEGDGRPAPPGGFEVLASGMTRPRSTLLAAFGLTPRRAAAEAAWERHKCSWCSLAACGFRRAG